MKPRHESVGTCERDSFLLFAPRRGLWPHLVCGAKRKNEHRALLNSPRRKTIAPVAAVRWIHITRIEVQVVCVRRRVVRRTPIVAVRTAVVERSTIVVARSREENIQLNDHHLSDPSPAESLNIESRWRSLFSFLPLHRLQQPDG